MADSRITPDEDGLADLFGTGAFEASPAPLPVATPAPHFSSRREARAAERPARASGRRAQQKPVASAPRRRAKPAARPARAALSRDTPRDTPRRRPGSALATMVSVFGLFACVALPAYAITPTDGADAALADAASSVTSRSLSVSEATVGEESLRDSFSATEAADLRKMTSDTRKQANYNAYMKSGAIALGDDYPWFSELSRNQGGGFSPLNYYYRECVDFVAWRLNRDAGTFKAPYAFVWSTLTPSGGDAFQWKYAWTSKGWPTGMTPVAGAVAWFGGHVAYVNSVNADGTVNLEEYNYGSDHLYGVRTIPASDVGLYLYAPPR